MKRYLGMIWLCMGMFFITDMSAAHVKDWKLSQDNLGPIKINMTLQEAEKATGIQFNSKKPDPDQAENISCFYVTLKGMTGISFMVEDNKIVRINISSPDYLTTQGAKIGDTEAQVQGLYKGKLEVEPHHYDRKGHYLTLIDKVHDRSIRFETNGKTITLIYSGKNEPVHFVEDCL